MLKNGQDEHRRVIFIPVRFTQKEYCLTTSVKHATFSFSDCSKRKMVVTLNF